MPAPRSPISTPRATPDGDGYLHQRQQDLLDPQRRRRRVPRLRALRARRRRHRLGAGRARHAGLHASASRRQLHERRAVVPLYFDNVPHPARRTCCWAPGGFKKQIAGFNVERLGNTARSLALGRYASTSRASMRMTRKQFGRPLCEFQGLQWKFAEMTVKLERAQLLLYRAARERRRRAALGRRAPRSRSSRCNQAGFDVANEAMQVMGGMGYSRKRSSNTACAACRGWMIAGGSIEILKNRIAEGVFERRSRSGRPRPADVFTQRSIQNHARRRLHSACSRRKRRARGRLRRRRQDGGPAAAVPARGWLRRPGLSDQPEARRRCWASGPGPRWPPCPKCPTRVRADAGRRRGRHVQECAEPGVTVATILASGFSEAGPDGAAARAELRELARTHRHAHPGSEQPRRRPSAQRARADRQCRFAEPDLPMGHASSRPTAAA